MNSKTLTTEKTADRIEVAILTGRSGSSVSDLADRLQMATARLEDGRALVIRRIQRLGEAHPIVASGSQLTAVVGQGLAYRAFLALSDLERKELEAGNRVLDSLVSIALVELLGPGSVVLNFAWPPAAVDDPRPAEFPQAVHWLGNRLGLDVGHGYRPPERQDGGVDLIVARPFAGSVKGSPTMMVQTTVSTSLREKSRDIDLGLWRTWIDLSPSTQRTLAVPYEATTTQLTELHRSGILALDRLRLAELVRGGAFWESPAGQHAVAWSETRLQARAEGWFE